MMRVEELEQRAVAGNPVTVILAGSRNRTSSEAALAAVSRGIARLVVIHDDPGKPPDPLIAAVAERVIDANSEEACGAAAVGEAAREGEAILLKGSLHSDALLRAVVRHMKATNQPGIVSDVIIMNDPFPIPGCGLLGIADGGILVRPDVAQKIAICRNAVTVFHALGVSCPRVAVLSATEAVSPSVPSSGEAAQVRDAASAPDFPKCLVDGPLALDLAKVPEALSAKGHASPLEGRADILLVPNVESGNMLAKALYWLGCRPAAHVATGGPWPVLIPSRSEDEASKRASIALAALASRCSPAQGQPR